MSNQERHAEKEKIEKVNHPNHYNSGKIEVWTFMESQMPKEQFEGFLAGNVIKYASRYPFKNGIEDLKKAQVYLNKLIEVKEKENV